VSTPIKRALSNPLWGNSPWRVDFHPTPSALPNQTDFAVVGGGFSGLSAAAWLRRFAPEKSVVLLESGTIGAGSSGHTGGLALAETAAGDLPGLGDVLAGFSSILKELEVDCDLALPGVYEVGRVGGLPDSPISWSDSGTLRAVKQVPGGTVDAGKMLTGLARAAERSGAKIFENVPVEHAEFGEGVCLRHREGQLRARKVLFATNAMSLELSGLAAHGQTKFTLAVATEPLETQTLESLGLASGRAFYTIDFPYLWGRTLPAGGAMFGGGLVHMDDWRELATQNVEEGEAARLIARLETRVRALHPALENVRFAHRWGGPILIAGEWKPVFEQHPRSPHAIALGAFSGHGVAQSVYLGRWAAEALCEKRPLPNWNSL
jgi:glycine/D-amino acid oxidase-like deaminating enzyme